MFTTRPEMRVTFGMVASTHWLASASGMAVLEGVATPSTPQSRRASCCRWSNHTTWHTEHFPSSFYPRIAHLNRLVIEEGFAPGVIEVSKHEDTMWSCRSGGRWGA